MILAPPAAPRARLIIDNDFGGDPDGLFQLAHHLLCPTMDLRAIVCSQHHPAGFYGLPGDPAFAASRVFELLKVMKLPSTPPVLEGAAHGLADVKTPARTAAAELIVLEVLRTDTRLPLYIACGAGLTTLASALLIEPAIADRVRLIWIGGPEHPGHAPPPPRVGPIEYNVSIDIVAARVVFNQSAVPIWQVPRNTYRQALISIAELSLRLSRAGAVGRWLFDALADLLPRANGSLGETYVLGDSPLVLLTALQSSWEVDPSSSRFISLPAPTISEAGQYESNPEGRAIRVYTELDCRLMFEDLFAKLEAWAERRP